MRLFLRLTADLNERLRALTRYHGDLSQYIEDALTSADLKTLHLVPLKAPRDVPGLTTVISDRGKRSTAGGGAAQRLLDHHVGKQRDTELVGEKKWLMDRAGFRSFGGLG
jgi:hypothetical protein